ncbi:PREDICTED: succinate dehydrogenase assembly factor 2, mitochondrial isoform X3 [Brassica oleracea var. oleracea]|uniref:succinate dehydrogenase assembly factor 2, mitochondrial isoform X3 n=1 Tax=Brassica oleracea var. oleracea TaxID=109376 RepID=UPI0006A71F78|nr:PREDICTED: succinate dehydrogenase assembly factor 2, mitochondrial isoform X3 [Brassica oleracea var. oleracea]
MASRKALINIHRIIRSTAVVNRRSMIQAAATRAHPIYGNGVDFTPRFFCGNTLTPQNFDIDLSNEEKKRITINRLLYRSKQRGFLELDLVLGNWVEENVNSMDENTVKSLIHVLDLEQPPEIVSSNPKVMTNLNKHAAPKTRAEAGQPWVKGWDDFKRGRDAPISGNQ